MSETARAPAKQGVPERVSTDITIAPGASLSINRCPLGGWFASVPHGGTSKTIAFTNSIDAIDWLGEVLIQSDGGSRNPSPGV